MSLPSVNDLEKLGRRQLQQLCKKRGIKANKKNVELMASLREQIKVQGLANQICSQGIIEGGHDSSQVEESSLLSTSQQFVQESTMVSDTLHVAPHPPKVQNEDASEMKQSTSSPQDFPPPVNTSEGTVPIKNLLDGCDDKTELLSRKRAVVTAVQGAEIDSTELSMLKRRCERTSSYAIDGSFNDDQTVGDAAVQAPQVTSVDELQNIKGLPTKRKRKDTYEIPPEVALLHVVQSNGGGDAELSQPGLSDQSMNEREPPTKRKRKGTYEIPPEVSSLHMAQDPASITYPVQLGERNIKEEILADLRQRVALRREMGDVPPVKVGKDVCATIQSKAPQSTHKSGRNWSKVHAKLFQSMESIGDYQRRKAIMAKRTKVLTAKTSRIPISKTSSKGQQKENSQAGVFTFVSKKEVKPAPVPFDLAASLKRTPKSYTPYKGPVPKFVS